MLIVVAVVGFYSKTARQTEKERERERAREILS